MRELAVLLADTVNAGGSVSFLAPLSLADAERWWRQSLAKAHPGAIFLVARDESGIVGSVQMHPAWAPNQPHRGDVAKLLVHRRARGHGLGTALMEAIEQRAREAGFTLLTLDTVRDGAADRLYRRSGWTAVGVIPGYALDPFGTPCDTVVFYKRLV